MAIVVKLGGSALSDATELAPILSDLTELHRAGRQLVVMHGGGPQATELCRRLGIERHIVGGRRITDAETLEVMKMILAGQVSVDLTAAMRARGLPAIGMSGVSARIIDAVKRPPRIISGGGDEPIDFGHVGDIEGVSIEPLRVLCEAGYIPVLNSLGSDALGRVYNINADIAANKVAQALGAEHLCLISGGVAGVMRDPSQPDSRIPSLTATEARQAIRDGIIKGGMIPKIEESLLVLSRGVGAIHILGSLATGDLLHALESPGSAGTVLVPDAH